MKKSEKITNWWKGRPVDNERLIGRFRPHWTALKIQHFIRWIKKEWKWLVATGLVLFGIFYAR